MRTFRHLNALSIHEATSALKANGRKASIIAGGTDLLGRMQDNVSPDYPELIINIKDIANLDHITEENGVLQIGTLAKLEDIANNTLINEKYSALAEAAGSTASPHIREMGTLGGNICQSNRCWYYWVPDNRFNCLRKGGSTCYAFTGDARYHSIFGSTRVDNTPCTTACPTNVDIPSYMSLIREGNIARAARILLENNPIPAITGRVCPHFCESKCNRSEQDESVSVRCIERFVGDYILEHPNVLGKPGQSRIEKKVAIVGSGPAGLSAAFYLSRIGHKVTVFENMEKPGGLLTYGIPPFRLPKDIVNRQIETLQKMGFQLKLNAKIGKKITVDDLAKTYDAVFLACGTWKERHSGIKGDQFILSGMEFLRNSNVGVSEIPGQKIAVLGGGNAAIDVSRTLVRLGANPVIIYRRSRLEMPALKEEVEKAEEEGIKIQFLTSPIEASKQDNKTVLKCIKMELGPIDESGRPRPIAVKGSEFITEFDAVMGALGEESDLSIIPGEFLDKNDRLKIDASTNSLGVNVFAGGDFVNGPSTVVQAIASGREAASSIDRYLGGRKKQDKGKGTDSNTPDKFDSSCFNISKRVAVSEQPVSERIKRLDLEDVSGLDINDAKMESNRCFNCGCVAVNPSDIAPVLVALGATIKTTRRVIEAEKFFTLHHERTTVLDDDEMVVEVQIPTLSSRTKAKFIKSAIRKSIDFPLVNCAAALECENGVVKNARICLNSVYTQPYRVTKAEKFIKGKSIDVTTAEAAANEIIGDTLPLANNRYKIQIAKALIKRAILACH
jgi:NADPH-dependent glutamate synthase beta subunit-like oxidoreductase/CO/xanthine dehydrogenase FAD-binding subunit